MSSSLPDSEALIPTTESTNDVPELQSFSSNTNGTSSSPDAVSNNNSSTRETLLEMWKGKETRRRGIGGQEQPLQLLDLPVDVLKEIIKEVTHTNDLASLALTCSALRGLTTPWIYSRFDIVWPDVHSNADSRQGVDALTYGLATLVMGDEPIGSLQTAESNHSYFCTHCGMLNVIPTSPHSPARINRKRRRGNCYPQYTRKFSLGNGPDEWTKDYLINRESGKMLGTLVALALARMPQLETFIWDMPTGILRDCWLALSSFDESRASGRSRLQNVWVRFHDNREILDTPDLLPTASQGTQHSPGHPPGPSQMQANSYFSTGQSPSPTEWSYKHTEHPSFSVLPPLRSLTVLNIDEIAYLEEMSVLIQRSVENLRVLRVGLASTVPHDGFASTRELNVAIDDDKPTEYQFVLRRLLDRVFEDEGEKNRRSCEPDSLFDPTANTPVKEHYNLGSENLITSPRLTAPALNMVSNNSNSAVKSSSGNALKVSGQALGTSDPAGILDSLVMEPSQRSLSHISATDGIASLTASLSITPPARGVPDKSGAVAPSEMPSVSQALKQDHSIGGSDISNTTVCTGEVHVDCPKHEMQLRLEALELEYVHLDYGVLLRATDWSVLTTLTLLNCDSQEELWRALRRAFTPRPITSQPVLRQRSKLHLRSLDSLPVTPSEYRLNLRRIHTNCVSPALISFLKETVAPNSVEWLFLQDGGTISDSSVPGGRRNYDSKVSLEAIYRGPLRRHRLSLKKLMIDSDDMPIDSRRRTPKWRKWKLDRDVLSFVISGKMNALREVAVAMDYQDWHFLLQRMPQVPHVRSLFVRHIADHPYGQHLNAKELALQVMDIVSLRPEMELCYLAVTNKCFEILEGVHDDDPTPPVHQSTAAPANPGPDDEDSNDEEEEEDEEDDDPDHVTHGNPTGDDSDLDSQPESLALSDDETMGLDGRAKPPRLKLREILFYDDKVSIFKARHGKL